jgi:hypothetical protein
LTGGGRKTFHRPYDVEIAGAHGDDRQIVGSDEGESSALGEWKQCCRIEIRPVDGGYVVR